MNNFLVVSFENTLEEHLKLAEAFNVAFEINDFYDPDILDNDGKIQDIIERYKQAGIPDGSTMHGAFLDVIVHSRDAAIRRIAKLRMRQSMDIAEQLGLKAVVFHTNYQPGIIGDDYEAGVIDKNVEILKELLEKHPTINIYLENMFEDNPKILVEISKKLIAYENYGICFDYGYAFVYGTDIKEWVELLAPFKYILTVRVKGKDMTTGEKIKKYRKLNNWTQRELGECINVNGDMIRKYENNVRTPKQDRLQMRAEVFCVPIYKLQGIEIKDKNYAEEILHDIIEQYGLDFVRTILLKY